MLVNETPVHGYRSTKRLRANLLNWTHFSLLLRVVPFSPSGELPASEYWQRVVPTLDWQPRGRDAFLTLAGVNYNESCWRCIISWVCALRKGCGLHLCTQNYTDHSEWVSVLRVVVVVVNIFALFCLDGNHPALMESGLGVKYMEQNAISLAGKTGLNT